MLSTHQKTKSNTVAMEVYDEIHSQFDHCYFLPNVKEGFGNQVRMQEQLLSGIFKTQVQIHTLNDGYKMMERLSMKKVLVVLDDVDNPHQIETLLGSEPSFGGGSRIILTTRDSHILSGFEWYEVKLLSERDAHTLFYRHAFKINKPSEEYDHFSRLAVKYAHGLPLALRVLGSSLHKRRASEWKYVLDKLKKIPDLKIQEVLKTSFDGLDRELKNIFLDIACFFRGMGKDYVTKVLLSSSVSPDDELKVLVARALLTISDSNKLEMHDLIQEMGREIESTKKSRKRSRFWGSKDVEGVLTGKEATEAVEGLMINDLSNSEIYFEAEAFVRMTNLRLLIFTGWNIYHHNVKIHVNGDLKRLFPELRVLVWHRCPLKSLPSNFHPKNLVYLDMRLSHLKRLWQGRKSLKKMISINLNYCKDLNETPDLTEATNLEKLELEGCISLREVHSSIAGLTNLVFLSLRGCRELKSLPSSIHLKSLKTLVLSNCSNLEMFPEISEDMEALSELHLDGIAIKELPLSIERLRRIQSLSMKNCKSLVCLPDSICNLAELRFLNLCGCLKLCNLPENLGYLESLWELLVDGSGIKQLPVSILRLKLGTLSFYYCKQMEAPLSARSSSIKGCFNVVSHINLSDCNLLELPDAIAHFPSLTVLYLSRTNLEKLQISVDDPTISKIFCMTDTCWKTTPMWTHQVTDTCWKTPPMWTHQVRVTPDMALEAEGPLDGFSWGEYGQMNLPGAKHPRVCYVCTPRNGQGCTAIKEVQRSNDDPTILKITYRGRHLCIQAYTISIGGRGDCRISEGGGALRIGDQVVQSPSSLGDNGSGGNVIRLADTAMDDNNVNTLPAANSRDMEHFQDVNHMANNDVAGYPNHVGEVSEGTSDAVVNQLEEEDPMDYEEALDFNGLKKSKREMDSDDDQPNESHSISNNNP